PDDGHRRRHLQGPAPPGPAALAGGSRGMSCEEVRNDLDDYVDGEVSERELHEIELHLAGCEACRGEERALRRLLALAAGLPPQVAPTRDLWPAIASGVARQRRPNVPGAGWWLGAVAAALAAVALWLSPV